MKKKNQMMYEINLNSRKFRVIITKKKIKKIIIRLNYRLEILVSSPLFISYSDALNYIFQNAEWLEKIINKYDLIIKEFSVNEFYEKKLIYIQGNKYYLEEKSNLDTVYKLVDNTFYFKGNIDRVIDKIYQDHYFLIEAAFNYAYKAFYNNIKQKPKLVIRKMKARWGSCNYNNGKININRMLICVPNELLHYVVVHEFTHLIFPNHSKQFYNFLNQVIPNYKEIEKQLKKYAFLLSN
ncbi:MAG TPA: M48 family metallopeptidase [Acholeplasmataceae bacterium]|nr:M48 family metallopeptidase [Acholeplasmataceae bacterium]